MTLFRFLPRRWWSVSAWRSWGTYVHWRLETFGVYYPDQRMNISSLKLMLRQLPSYMKWIADQDAAHRKQSQ